ncbi:MAG: RagB/SusD family nutrient uptake outer membrane protein [Chitinophaga sp.]|uniref:RagB/SusD family nutrient uptake outer membrane protein n=1 Tax=Chitinophaga sp. TaxID=1869181 RepID=UPI001B0C50A9|nr:RagB/SusD family nutrient uptake outer membrane protein [Chitinophaga sp.]MBO9731570.1 RagB/SusD family nutrient uptake outer membrane protein [Chitinophaga sp.]
MKKVVVIALLAGSMISCKKFLAERSQTEVIPKTTKNFGEILYTEGYPTNGVNLQPYISLMDDDIQCYNGDVIADQQLEVTMNAGAFQWQPNFIDVCKQAGAKVDKFDSWRTYYKLILGTNVALQYLDNSIGEASDKTMYKGEAYALRAFYHFMLVNLYAKPYNDSTTTPDKLAGIPLKLNANLAEDLPARNTVKEVYAQVTQDLDSAINLLEQVGTTQKLYRISATAAHLLASRVYLYMENWDKAIAHADYVLSHHPQLMDLNKWPPDGAFTDFLAYPLMGVNNVETIWYYGSLDEPKAPGTYTAYGISHDLARCFDTSDLRSQVYFCPLPEFLKLFVPGDYNFNKTISDYAVVGSDMGTSWRSSEAYLNRAEAYIQKYKKGDASGAAEALKNLNTLRVNRYAKGSYVNWTIETPDKLLEMCRTERRRELFHEAGHRWFDLRRYGMPSISHIYAPTPSTTTVYTLAKRDPQYVLPIPIEVLQRNTSMPQNQQISGLRQPQ